MFPRVIATIIAEYVAPMELRSWIEPGTIIPERLLANPNALGADLPSWAPYSNIPDHVSLEMQRNIMQNPSPLAGVWVRKNIDRIFPGVNDTHILMNPSDWAGEIVASWIIGGHDPVFEYGENLAMEIDWKALSTNPAPWAVSLLSKNLEHIDYFAICANPSEFAIKYMHDRDYYVFEDLHKNPHPWAVAIINNRHIRDESMSSTNPSLDLIQFLREGTINGLTNPYDLATNPNIFKQKKKRVATIAAELF